MSDQDDEEAEALLTEMSPAIADLLRRMMAPHPHTWEQTRAFRDEIQALNRDAHTELEQASLVFAFTRLMDSVEEEGLLDDLEYFRNLRESDYRFLLMVQGSVNDVVDPDKLAAVTQREVGAGRMAPDNDFHEFAMAGARILGGTPEPPVHRGLISRLFGRR